MKEIIFYIGALIFSPDCLGQAVKQIEIQEIFITDSSQMKSSQDFKSKSNVSNFFEDDKYIVRTTCSGEFGGTVWFKNKKTGIEYSCSATCPVIINKIANKYFVTTSLLHMRGSSGVIEIDNRDAMKIFKLKPNTKSFSTPRFTSENRESQSIKGTKLLADTIGILALTSFSYQSKLYHILYNLFDKFYIATIRNNKFKIIDTIPTVTSSMINKYILTTENHLVAFFSNDCTRGYVEIFDNKINVIRYDHLLDLGKNCH